MGDRLDPPQLNVEIMPPLADCFRHCKVECVAECCGVDAFSTDPELIARWSGGVGPDVAREAGRQLEGLIEVVEDHSRVVSCEFLNHLTIDAAARQELLSFLGRFAAALKDDC